MINCQDLDMYMCKPYIHILINVLLHLNDNSEIQQQEMKNLTSKIDLKHGKDTWYGVDIIEL